MTSLTYVRSPAALSCDLGDGAAILDSRSNLYFTLNATGMLIWDMLPATADSIVNRLCGQFAVNREQVESDVDAVLAQLQEQALVTVSGHAPTASSPT